MIIGNGLLASVFWDQYAEDTRVIVFASGVSNSSEKKMQAYEREKSLLLNTLKGLHENQLIIYFSTCSIYDESKSDDMYVKHKKEMEECVSSHATNYYIVRLPQLIAQSKNKHTLLNFFYEHIQSGQKINIFSKSTRNLIDVDDAKAIVVYLVEHNLYQNSIVNIANQFNYTPMEIVRCFEELLGVKANINLLDKGARYTIDITRIAPICQHLNIDFDAYLPRKIKKHYAVG